VILREFNDFGIAECHTLLDGYAAGDTARVDPAFLTDETFSSSLSVSLPPIPKAFASRFELAIWLANSLESHFKVRPVGSAGMWTWLTFAMLDVVAPPRADGTRKIQNRPLYVLEGENWLRYYRHLLAAPCRVIRAHWAELHVTRPLLAGRPDSPGELFEQIASRSEIISSTSLVRLAGRLYWDGAAGALKKGHAGKGGGSARRLATLLSQLDLTWDFETVSDDALLTLLPPKEYRRFLDG
jgi:hypothetical protein